MLTDSKGVGVKHEVSYSFAFGILWKNKEIKQKIPFILSMLHYFPKKKFALGFLISES